MLQVLFPFRHGNGSKGRNYGRQVLVARLEVYVERWARRGLEHAASSHGPEVLFLIESHRNLVRGLREEQCDLLIQLEGVDEGGKEHRRSGKCPCVCRSNKPKLLLPSAWCFKRGLLNNESPSVTGLHTIQLQAEVFAEA